MPSSLLQVVNSLFQTTGNKQCEHILIWAWQQPCYNHIRYLWLQLVCRSVTTCALLRVYIVASLLAIISLILYRFKPFPGIPTKRNHYWQDLSTSTTITGLIFEFSILDNLHVRLNVNLSKEKGIKHHS
jgi:hypothetical protein